MPPLSLLIKPASSNCNLKCKYCFYHSIAENRVVPSYGMMDNDTLETLVSKALRYADYSCTFAFQGGEPTLVGLDFYRKLIELIKTYNVKNIDIHYAIQTNGLLINDEWARFLAQNKFLVGISWRNKKYATQWGLMQEVEFLQWSNDAVNHNKWVNSISLLL